MAAKSHIIFIYHTVCPKSKGCRYFRIASLRLQDAVSPRYIVRAIHRKQRIAVIDWRYRLLVFFWKLIPAGIWKRMPVKN